MDLKYPQRSVSYLKQKLQYMGNVIFIKERKVCVKPLRSRIEAIQKLNPLQHQEVVKVLQAW